MNTIRWMLTAVAAVATFGTAQAGFFFTPSRAALAGTDTLNWTSVAPPVSTISFPFSITSTGGKTATVSAAGDGDNSTPDQMQIQAQNNGWNGKFAVGDPVLYSLRSGPVTITFANAITAAGAQFEPVQSGMYTARLELLAQDGVTVLATSDFAGNSAIGTQGDGSAQFAGFIATSGDSFYGIRFSGLTTVGTNPIDIKDFGINQLSFSPAGGASLVPAPAGLLAGLIGTGAFGLGRLVRRRNGSKA